MIKKRLIKEKLLRLLFIFLTAVILVVFVYCISLSLPGPNPGENLPDEHGNIAGFWQGFWHGLVALITLIFSFFSDKVNIYEIHNSGGWYNLGFMVGIAVSFAILAILTKKSSLKF